MALMACEVAFKAFATAQVNLLISTFKEVTRVGITNIVKDTYLAELKMLQSGVGERFPRARWGGASEA